MKYLFTILLFLFWANPVHALIAFDASSGTTGASVTSLTVSHTCSGSNRILWGALFLQSGDNVTGMTYNGVAMTQAVKKNVTGTVYIYLYYLIAPSTGANDLVATFSSDANPSLSGMSFTGASQTGQPDATTSNSGGSSPITTTLTTIADNSAAVMFTRVTTSSSVASTNSTLVVDNFTEFYRSTSLAITPAGSFNMQATYTTGVWGAVMASFSPAAEAPTLTSSIISLVKAFWIW